MILSVEKIQILSFNVFVTKMNFIFAIKGEHFVCTSNRKDYR